MIIIIIIIYIFHWKYIAFESIKNFFPPIKW